MNTLEARIRAATRATAEEIAPGTIPPLDLPGRARPGRPRPGRDDPRRGPGRWARVLIPVAAAASVIAVVASAVVITSGPHDKTAGSSPGGLPGVPSGSARHVPFRSVPFPASPFRSLVFRYTGPGPLANDLDCVTASVCYAWGSDNDGHGAERTADGGATWRPLAALPDHQHPSALASGLSCPTTAVCFGVTGALRLAVTTDGGGRWRTESLPKPPGSSGASIDQVSCATAEKCVVHILINGEGTAGTYFFTVNGGQAWTQAGAIPSLDRAAPGQWFLRCDLDGRCIGLAPTGSAPKIRLAALRSADGGRTWTATSTLLPTAGSTLMMSCGDALHCTVASSAPTLSSGTSNTASDIATTSDGGVTWQVSTPHIWVDSISCPNALVCFMAAADTGPSRPVIDATHDGGRTWTTIPLPRAGGSALALVNLYPLGCPSQAGCIGVGVTPKELAGRSGQGVIISSLPAS